MLKALELVGFKSFADRTRFEFPRGITCVVGPNGSGKSNVVDAIKWVLGEQSAKTLRGKEMADVIFNGSSGRPPLNAAESTLTIDNANQTLPIDTSEVHITRRVYRSGESEYLINRQPCRLRDIRDLFAGTGAATEAYSVIEQGKVDVLLQSSPRDRRAIFEEAAGISRFKAKKLECQRRLERVEQNLLRLGDIVGEVESQLRSVRLQAGKAQRYRQHADRLQELRTQVALVDYRRLSEQLEQYETELATLHEQITTLTAEAEQQETRALELETEIDELSATVRASEARIAEDREQIASLESTIAHERARLRELEAEQSRLQQQLASLTSRANAIEQQWSASREAVGEAEEEYRQASQMVATEERKLTELTSELDRLRGESEQRRAACMEAMREQATLGNQITALETQQSTAAATLNRLRQRVEQLERQCVELEPRFSALQEKLAPLVERADGARRSFAALEARLAERRAAADAARQELSKVREELTAADARASVLEELEERLEGFAAGVKEILVAARGGEQPFCEVRGVVADLLDVDVASAPLVELALGERAQHVVVGPGSPLWTQLEAQQVTIHGRVGFLRLETQQLLADRLVDLRGRPGVIARADTYVDTAPEYTSLARRLLGETWIVEDLASARRLAAEFASLDFVTLSGELLAADGTLVVSGQRRAGGILSRKSELRSLREQAGKLEQQEHALAAKTSDLAKRIAADEQRREPAAEEKRSAEEALAEHRLELAALEEKLSQTQAQLTSQRDEMNEATSGHETVASDLAAARSRLSAVEEQLTTLERELEFATKTLEAADGRRRQQVAQATTAQVQLAKAEERLSNLRAQQRHLEQTQEERQRTIGDLRRQLTECRQRREQSEAHVLSSSAQVAELYLRKEGTSAEVAAAIGHRTTLNGQRSECHQAQHRLRGQARKLEERHHSEELAAGEIRLQRSNLVTQLRDDYDIDLAELEHEPTEEEQHQREEVEQEIADLRRKINNMGNVNLDALAELDSLEARHASLAGQYGDLREAKESLEKIIERINTDSRRLFTETLEIVRGHFQTLFRKLFGGGQADIILDEDADVLESGIEIVARPPGKEPRSISLLSGGEKTLTCVALLLAIFRSRPSPFCVLDEVDAALDEANIERFIAVLNEFLAWTQFIVVTHSKKTMTCAHTLYGVTMQESGISKRVSVHFDDVSDDGHIRQVPNRDSTAGEEPDDDSAADDSAAA